MRINLKHSILDDNKNHGHKFSAAAEPFQLLRISLLCLILLMSLSFLKNAEAQEATGAEAVGSYDPFSDYSEFEEASEEEADINFFRNGRFLTIGLKGGMRGFTGTYGDIQSNGGNIGLYLAFFLDLRFALQVSYSTSSHDLSLIDDDNERITGTVELSGTSFSIKYFTNTQNVTKGLSSFNPYLIGGFSQLYRTTKSPNTQAYSRDGALGLDFGGGIEIPVSRNKVYLGLEAIYSYINFEDENTRFSTKSPSLNGDIWNVNAVIGVNF